MNKALLAVTLSKLYTLDGRLPFFDGIMVSHWYIAVNPGHRFHGKWTRP